MGLMRFQWAGDNISAAGILLGNGQFIGLRRPLIMALSCEDSLQQMLVSGEKCMIQMLEKASAASKTPSNTVLPI